MKFRIIQRTKADVPLETWSRLLPEQFKYFDGLEKEGTDRDFIPSDRAAR